MQLKATLGDLRRLRATFGPGVGLLYIKLQSLLRTKLPIDLPKHMSALLKTRSKQDLQTTKHLLTNGTLLNLENTCGN